jgi:hypothetical protein
MPGVLDKRHYTSSPWGPTAGPLQARTVFPMMLPDQLALGGQYQPFKLVELTRHIQWTMPALEAGNGARQVGLDRFQAGQHIYGHAIQTCAVGVLFLCRWKV